jgi:hypothetical protein
MISTFATVHLALEAIKCDENISICLQQFYSIQNVTHHTNKTHEHQQAV